MKFNKYYLMSAVFCMALASCSDDMTEEQGGNPDNTEQTEGEATYATFSFDFNKGGLARAEVGEAGTTEEQEVKNFTLLIFKNDQAHEELSTLEVVKTVTVSNFDTDKTITMLVTSGPKKVYILANAIKLLAQINDPDALTLNKTLLSEFEKQVFDIAYDGNTDDKNGVLGDAGGGLLMTGVASADLASGIKVEDFTSNVGGPTEAAKPNVVNVSIDRASSKISMGVNDVASSGDKTFTVVASGSTAQMVWLDHAISENLGTLPLTKDAMRFAIYNQNTKENVIANMGAANDGNNIIQDPNYTVTDNGDYSMYFNWASNNQTDFYTTYKSNNGDVTKGLGVVNAKSNDESAKSFYVPENTNQWATKGNTTYAMIEGTFVPDQTRTVDASSDANAFQAASVSGNFLFKAKKDAAIAAGTGFIYCEDYDAFFTADLTSGTLTRKTDITTSIHSLKAIKYIAAKMISDANQSATGKEDAMQAKLIGGENSDVKGHALTTVTVNAEEPGNFTGNQWYAIVTADATRNVGIKDGDKDNAQYFTIEVKRANDQGNALIDTKANNSAAEAGSTKAYIPAQKVTIAVYPQGKCYYRVNIEDPAYSNTVTPFRYAVIRNYWYQIDLAKFTALGYPNPAIAAGEAGDALGADTNVKTTITVKAWSVKNMKPEVGL
ncbi:fimbria major subunit [Phocaeicola sartorii]|uniref:fimbria major subunit n=1 Tax=Phocaeicola sartorii TaxID=671267 RepID=UPI00242AB0F0|nr:fimbria major subunit [Phocaeicola sartorii]